MVIMSYNIVVKLVTQSHYNHFIVKHTHTPTHCTTHRYSHIRRRDECPEALCIPYPINLMYVHPREPAVAGAGAFGAVAGPHVGTFH